jgi:NMD protein affecting ribosome stability and mRNA decay
VSRGDPIGDDVRKLRRARRLGTEAVCVLCGEENPVELRQAGRSLLEAHHPGGSANDARLTVVVCRNCHAVLTEAGRISGVELGRSEARHLLERLEAVLRGQADFDELRARRQRAWADALAAEARRLDRDFPDWRRDE